MDLWSDLPGIMLLLAAAVALGLALDRLRQSAIVGYMAAGVLLSPGILGVVRGGPVVAAVAEVGVILLLFTVGLEFPWRKVRAMGAGILAAGGAQVGVTWVLATAAFWLAGFSLREGIILGGMVTPSTTSLLLRLFVERAETDSVHARNASVITVLQGAFDVPLLILISTLGERGAALQVLWAIVRAAWLAAAVFGVLYAACNVLLPRLLEATALSKNRELPILLAVVTCLFSAWVARRLGISPALGGFIAGTLMAESPYMTQVKADVNPLKTIFATLFFASFGISVDLGWAWSHLGPALGAAAAILAGKALVLWPIMRVFGSSHRNALATGVCLAPVDEFVFVLAQIGVSSGLLDQATFQLIVSAALITLLATPFLVSNATRLGQGIEAALARLRLIRPPEAGERPRGNALRNHVIVVGFGPAGRGVAAALKGSDAPVVVCDLNPRTVAAVREQGLMAEVGDASLADVLERVNVAAARALVLCVPDHRTALQVIGQARALAPHVQVIARARYHVYAADIESAGAHVVVDEEMHIGQALGAEALRRLPSRPSTQIIPTDPT